MRVPTRRLETSLLAVLTVAAAQFAGVPAAAAGSQAASPATASRPTVGGRQIRGVIPLRHHGEAPVRSSGSSNPNCSGCSPPLLFQDASQPLLGGITGSPGHVTIVPYYWSPPGYTYTTNYINIINRYIADVAADSGRSTNVFSAGTQYYEFSNTPAHHLAYAITAGPQVDDNTAFPTSGCSASAGFTNCITDAQLVSHVEAKLTAIPRPIDDAHLYMVMFPQQVQTCFDSSGARCSAKSGGYCAYHSGAFISGSAFVYANEPFPELNGCGDPFNGAQAPNGDAYADTLLSSFSHEANEALTDSFGPVGTWNDVHGNENGDECAYTYGAPVGGLLALGTAFNQVINGHPYYTQDEFSNEDYAASQGDLTTSSGGGSQVLGCVQREELPTASFTPPSNVAAGVSAGFTGSGADADTPSATFSYTWNWGDGTSNSSGASVNHTFGTGGSYSVTLTVGESDGDGWSGSVTHVIAVTGPNFLLAPSTTPTAGNAFSLVVAARNADGTTNTSYVGTVHFTSADGQAVLPADYTYTGVDAGVHAFSVTLKTAGSRTVTATDTVSSIITGTVIETVLPASATHFSLDSGLSQLSRITFPLTVTAFDAFGNTATGYAGLVHFSSNDPAATLPGDSTLVSGQRTFSLGLQTTGPHTITATDSVNGSITGTTSPISVLMVQDQSSSLQYSLAGSDGVTWEDMDPSLLRLNLAAPVGATTAILSANADLWTANAGYNQDIGVFVSVNGGADQLLAWKESGGFAGTFSPNAAYLQTVYAMSAGNTYLFKLKWKTNRPAPGVIIRSGAGPIGNLFSPTRLSAQIVPTAASTLFSTVGVKQYVLTGSDGATWAPMGAVTADGTSDNLSVTISPSSTGTELIGGNSDLWTMNAGFNQDIGIFVSVDGGPDQLVSWKESGGFAGTFSPNAAFVQGTFGVTAGHTYVFKLEWKTNIPAPLTVTIRAGAGPISNAYSPTRITAQFLPNANLTTAATSNEQYTLYNSDGASWQLLDPSNEVKATFSPSVAQAVLVGGNADLWTVDAGYNQDLAIFVSVNNGPDQLVAWKESGGFAGTFSPNAAFVQAAYDVTPGNTYVFKLEWKTNKPAPGATIHIGAGPIGVAFSPTRITVQVPN